MSNLQAELEPRQKHRHESGDYLLDHEGRCWFCGRKPAVESQEGEVTVEGTVITMPEHQPEVDVETGEVFAHQPTLDATIFPATERRQVPMVKIGFSGSVEMTQSEWEAYCKEGLEPGRVVKLSMTGYLPNPHAKWVKRTEKQEDGSKDTWWEQEGAVKVKALELGSFELRGFYDGE